MIRYITQLILTCTIFLSACSQQDAHLSKAEELEIHEAVNQSFTGLVAAVKSLDADSYYNYFEADKFTSLNEYGTVTHSFREFKSTYDQQLPLIKKYKSLEFSNVKITVIDKNTAILVNEYDAEVVLQSGDSVFASGAGTQVWSNTTSHWKLVNVSSSTKP